MDFTSFVVLLLTVWLCLVASQFPIPSGNAPSCLDCRFLSSPTECEHSRQCHPGEACFLGEVVDDNATFYLQYCYPEPGCINMAKLVEQGRTDLQGHTFNWISCCKTDNCNDAKQ